MRDYKRGIKRPRSENRTCIKCGVSTGSTRTRCDDCAVPKGKGHPNYEKYCLRKKERDAEYRALVLGHYGDFCACCGEVLPPFLTVDHINGERYGSGRRGGAELYRWLVKNSFPQGFRILCFNCNGSLGFRGYCPHGNLTQARHAGRPTKREMTDTAREVLRLRWLRAKIEALDAYGGARCTCCGEQQIEFLTLDHLNDDGAEQRRALTGKNYGSIAKFYAWLKREGYPPLSLTVRCLNCNAGRYRSGGTCPHGQVMEAC